MITHWKNLAMCLALTAATALAADRAGAQALSARAQAAPPGQASARSPGAPRDVEAPAAETPPSPATMETLRLVASQLEETALQRDFRTDEDELDHLIDVNERLGVALRELCCARRAMALRLQSNLESVIATAAAQLAPALATHGAFGPSAPNRDELAILAKQSQALVRNNASFPVASRTGELLSARHEDPKARSPRDEAWSTEAPSNSWIEFSPGRDGMQMYGWRF